MNDYEEKAHKGSHMQKYILISLILIIFSSCKIDPFPDTERTIIAFDAQTDYLNALERLGVKVTRELGIISGVQANLTDDQRAALSDLPFVRYIERDVQVFALDMEVKSLKFTLTGEATPDDEMDWGLEKIRANECWVNATGAGVRIGIIDTGIYADHPDLQGAVVDGYNAIDGGSWTDDNNHGTYVATVTAARRNNIGIIGVAPDASLYAIKVLSASGSGYSSDVCEGYEWAVNEGLDVVNLSLGSYSQSRAMAEAMERAGYAGVGTVAAAGNDGRSPVIYPARNPKAIVVGAAAMDGNVSSFSNYGPAMIGTVNADGEIEGGGVIAPGEWVLAGNKLGEYQRVSGTSIATPYVTGLVALLIEMGWCERKFIFGAASRAGKPDEYYGYGLIDAKQTIENVIAAGQ